MVHHIIKEKMLGKNEKGEAFASPLELLAGLEPATC